MTQKRTDGKFKRDKAAEEREASAFATALAVKRAVETSRAEDLEKRIRDAMVVAIMDAANKLADHNTKFVTAHLLAGCTREQVPSSARVVYEAIGRLRKLAATLVDHPIPDR